MIQGIRTVIYHVKDLALSKEWYTRLLGKPPYFDESFYVGFNVEGFELGLQPDVSGAYFENNTVAYWGVADAVTTYQYLLANNCIENEPIRNVGEGILLGTVIDPAGNVLGIIQNPHFKYTPPTL
ncbi:VOC family protein [Segetibacter sp. 3557_3]|uniref:VOC family protein n=1 Tax=Segetibacter sp. 3557_3 TaxID=2547429 RepID=UPI001058AFCB|nr:VOC family protein [Segetibacter sp. 3557_3]TDH29162.1 VOC family protein [Segetibacter sp. 3557_3]